MKRPADHHLRVWYVLADLYERAGDLPRARELFDRIARADPSFADVAERLPPSADRPAMTVAPASLPSSHFLATVLRPRRLQRAKSCRSPSREQAKSASRPPAPTPKRDGLNLVVVRGRVSSPPDVRVLPSEAVLAQLQITTPPRSRDAVSVPVAVWTRPAWVESLEPGDEVVVIGRVRRRFFRAGGAAASRWRSRPTSWREPATGGACSAAVGPRDRPRWRRSTE